MSRKTQKTVKPASKKLSREDCFPSTDQDAFHRQSSEESTDWHPRAPPSHDAHHDEQAHHLGGRCLHTYCHTPPADFCSTTRPASTPASFRTSSLRMNNKAEDLVGGSRQLEEPPLTTSPESRPRHPLSPFGSTTKLETLIALPSGQGLHSTTLSRKKAPL